MVYDLIVRNASLVLGSGVQEGIIAVKDGMIARVGREIPDCRAAEVIDASGDYLAPGVVDLHTHGAGGFDYMDGTVEDILGAARAELGNGTTTVLPTTLTSSDEDLFLFLDNFKTAQGSSALLPRMPGVHLEGPYFDMVQKGAQDPRYIREPERRHYLGIVEKADGVIKRWSLAPELPGAIDMLDDLADEGILFSAGHTAATYDDISRAYDHGVRLLTHFYSGMSSIERKGGWRILGAVESGYLIDDLSVEIIADGLHLPPQLLTLIFKCKKHDRITACTDSMRGAGMPDGPSILGPKDNGQEVIVEDGIAKMPDRSCFAGSVATGIRLVRTLSRLLPLSEVAAITSLQPARLIGMDNEIGSIEAGKKADFIIFDKNIDLTAVFIGGRRFA